MKKALFISAALLLILLAFNAGADDEKLEKLPGYFDFGSFDDYQDRETSVEVYVKEPLLSIVRVAMRREEPELAELLSKIKLIKVRTFSIDDQDTDEISTRVTDMGQKLDREGWEKIVRVKDYDEQVYVYMKSTNGNIDGMVVIAVEYDEEAAFVNIVGEITPESLEKLYGRFSIPELDSIRTSSRSKRIGRIR
ncbi:MAG: DUF4252 domain-containing protein [Gemmatimonadota bacterium]|nr:MAG: DUF4252 domain-containing protein [Gemmatimonadota bacterium]